MTRTDDSVHHGFDRQAAVTRSMLGWGVVAGPFYLLTGLVQALLAPGFDLTRHPLSLLMLGDTGWVQTLNLVLTGIMVAVAATGFVRAAAGSGRGWRLAAPLGIYGLCLVASAVFPPDPMAGFPPAGGGGEGSASGLLHLVFGAVGFLALAVAAFTFAGWARSRGSRSAASWSVAAGVVVVVGFAGGAALSTSTLGVLLLWAAVVAGFSWLLAASVYAYRTVPHPDEHRRVAP